jgi:ferric iron reductase protein FhuF
VRWKAYTLLFTGRWAGKRDIDRRPQRIPSFLSAGESLHSYASQKRRKGMQHPTLQPFMVLFGDQITSLLQVPVVIQIVTSSSSKPVQFNAFIHQAHTEAACDHLYIKVRARHKGAAFPLNHALAIFEMNRSQLPSAKHVLQRRTIKLRSVVRAISATSAFA